MANTIILEWDPQRVRAAVGSPSPSSPAVQRVVSFELDSGEESDEVVTMAESIAAGLKQNRVGKGDAIVVVERSAAELRVLCVPPVPPEELPAVVRFQANREFSSLSEGWLLDYVPLPAAPNGQQRVLAAAISPQVAAQIRGCCDNAGLHLRKVILRPFAAGRLLAAAGIAQESCVLVEVLEESAELTVFHQGSMQLTRSVRISPEASVQAVGKQVQMELRRTLTSFRNQQQDSEVKRVLLMVPADLAQELESTIPEQLSLECHALDPWTLFSNLGSVKGSAPEAPYRFAAVLGGLCEPIENFNEIDFVNPTRPPAPPSQRRRNVLIGATVATLLLSLGGLYWMRSSQLNQQIDQLRAEVAEMSREDQKYQDRLKEIDMLNQWVGQRVNWLEEMGQVSQQFPLPDDAIVDNLGLAIDENKNLAVISMVGRVSSTEAIRALEKQLRDPDLGREMSGRQNSPTSQGPYKFRFDETLTIDLSKREGSSAEESIEADATLTEVSVSAEPDSDASVPEDPPVDEADEADEVDQGESDEQPAAEDDAAEDDADASSTEDVAEDLDDEDRQSDEEETAEEAPETDRSTGDEGDDVTEEIENE